MWEYTNSQSYLPEPFQKKEWKGSSNSLFIIFLSLKSIYFTEDINSCCNIFSSTVDYRHKKIETETVRNTVIIN